MPKTVFDAMDMSDGCILFTGRSQKRGAKYMESFQTSLGLPGKGHNDRQSEPLLAAIRAISPKIIINNRLDLPIAADIYPPEQVQPTEWVKVEGGTRRRGGVPDLERLVGLSSRRDNLDPA